MTAAYRHRRVWAGSRRCVAVVLGFYLVSLQVAAERKQAAGGRAPDRSRAARHPRARDRVRDPREPARSSQRWNGDTLGSVGADRRRSIVESEAAARGARRQQPARRRASRPPRRWCRRGAARRTIRRPVIAAGRRKPTAVALVEPAHRARERASRPRRTARSRSRCALGLDAARRGGARRAANDERLAPHPRSAQAARCSTAAAVDRPVHLSGASEPQRR